MQWFDEPVSSGGSVTITDSMGQETTIDTNSQIEGEQSVELDGVGTVTIAPGPGQPPETKGDQVANTTGQIIGAVTGVSALGLLATKLLGSVIGSRRKRKPPEPVPAAPNP
jgi:hypothetical protein